MQKIEDSKPETLPRGGVGNDPLAAFAAERDARQKEEDAQGFVKWEADVSTFPVQHRDLTP